MRAAAPQLREVLALLNREATPFVRWRLAWLLVLVVISAVLTAASGMDYVVRWGLVARRELKGRSAVP